jgi:hypothetical protein
MSMLTSNPYLQEQMNQKAPQDSFDLSGLFPGASPAIQNLLKQLSAAGNQANTANQTRYKDVLGMFQNLGQSEAQQIQQQGQQAQAQGVQDLTSRGLGNTTITSSVNRGIASDTQNAMTNLQGKLAGQEASAMEGMNQQAPNLSQYGSLLQSALVGQQKKPMGLNPGTYITYGSGLGGGGPRKVM